MKKNLIAISLLSVLLVSPVSVYAVSESTIDPNANFATYTKEQLEALIVKLQKYLTELKKSNTIACSISNVDLSLGDGEDNTSKEYVKSLQNFLKEKGYIVPAQAATGYFGKITRTAVMNLQRDLGIAQTGEVDATLRSKISTMTCKKAYLIEKKEYKEEIKKEIKEVKKELKPEVSKTPVTSIQLYGEGNYVKWMTQGYSKNGFKVVYSKTANPTYPNRDTDRYVYLSEPSSGKTALEAFDGSGTYYVRVCEYLGGACGVYSNEIKLSL